MSDYLLKEMSGSLFSNSQKEKESQPDYTGNALINGERIRIAGWIRKSATGKNYLSLKLSTDDKKKDSFVDVEEDFPI